MTLDDLDDIEQCIKSDGTGFQYTPIRPEEVLALIKIVRATVAYHDKPSPKTGTVLFEALREAGR